MKFTLHVIQIKYEVPCSTENSENDRLLILSSGTLRVNPYLWILISGYFEKFNNRN